MDQESTVELEGSGTSADGSELSGHDLGWSSDVDGRLGTGESISVMDLSQGPHTITLTATDDEGISASESVDILVESPGFDIRVRLLDDFTSSEEAAIRNGLEPWTTAITEDLSPVFPSPELAKRCSLVEGEGIDDLVVNVTTRPDEGFSGLAAGIPCGVRDDEGNLTTSISGIVFINEAELDHPQLEDIIIHEVGHTLGIGVAEAWTTNESDMDTRDPFHAGPNTREAFNRLGGEAYLSEGVPISPGHWREENFGTELMTPFLDEGSPNPLSRVTIATLADIGYEVDRSAADSYVLPMPQEAIWLAEADATLGRSSLASQNFGQPSGSRLDTTLVAGANVDSLWTDEAPEDEIFSGLVQFGVPSSLPMGVNVEEAELLLTVGDRKTDTTDHNIGVFSVSESWSEEMVTWDSRPAVEDTPVTTFEHQSCEDCRVDLTGLSTDWVSGDTPNHGVALRAPDAPSAPTFSIGFASRHFETSSSDSTGIVASSRPRIVVKASTSEAALKAGFRRSSGEKVFLGNDIPSGMMIYGVSPDGRIVQTKRIR